MFKCDSEATIVHSGSITVPAKRLLQIIKELPDMPLTFSCNEQNHVSIDCEKTNFKIIGLPKEEFPPIIFFDESSIELEQKDLKEMLKQTAISVSSDTTRHIFKWRFI